MGQLVADVPSGLSLTPPQETERNSRNMNVGYTRDDGVVT
jgi:hypothetical protein